MAASNKNDVKKPNIFVRIGRKFKEVFSELKRVTWPTFPKVLKSTGVVLLVVVVFLVVVTAINFGLQALLDLVTGIGGTGA
ncbi:MAG TPA: preprotein translocase subunit SecE [Candidatus Coproplasma excrementavium]|nr:preprotein translocase subunit SecE [Candidatus Coproplasma excrementavium]